MSSLPGDEAPSPGRTPRPPRLARWVLRRLVPPGLADAIDGDLLERFHARARRDPAAAGRWYVREVARSAGPLFLLVARDTRVLRWPLGLAVGVLATSFAPDAAIRLLGGLAGVATGAVPLPMYLVAAAVLAGLGSCAAAWIAGVRGRVGRAVVLLVLYGPAVPFLATSPDALVRSLPALALILPLAWVGAVAGSERPPSRAG